MKNIFLSLFLGLFFHASGQQLPQGTIVDSNTCSYLSGYFNYSFTLNNEFVGMIEPDGCNYGGLEDGQTPHAFYANFYGANHRDTLSSQKEAMSWMTQEMEDYYKPVTVAQWQKISVQTPEFSLQIPSDWSYRTDTYDGAFKSKATKENKLILLIEDQRGKSEVVMLIRTPNTAGLTTKQAIEWNAMMNRAIDLKSNPTVDFSINGKIFQSTENIFMMQMEQHHFWYADAKEIIYINYNMLKDERIRYPEVMKAVIASITW